MNTVWKRLIVGSLRRVQILIGRANKKSMDPELEALGWSGVAKRRFSLKHLGRIIRLPYLLAESSRREINWFQIPKSLLLLFLQQSWEQEILETKLLFHGTIFHFYNYCRKSNHQPQNQQFSVFNQVKTLQHSAYWAVFKLTAGGPKIFPAHWLPLLIAGVEVGSIITWPSQVFRAGGHDLCLYFACTGGNAYKDRKGVEGNFCYWIPRGQLVSSLGASL